jgi:hypothetical protein
VALVLQHLQRWVDRAGADPLELAVASLKLLHQIIAVAWLLGQQLQQHIFDVAAPPPAPPATVLVEWIAAARLVAAEVPVKSPMTSRGPARAGFVAPAVVAVRETLVG